MNDAFKDKQVVLIEDNHLLAELIKKKFESHGATVYAHTNGRDGLEAIRSILPDLVLLDIMLPIMNGYEVMETMKVENLVDRCPVLVISNSGQPVEIQRIIQLGAKDSLVKADFTPEEIIEKAKKIINDSSYEKENDMTPENKQSWLKVFVVEDDVMLRDLLYKKFVKVKFECMFTNDGTQAAELAKQYEPDALVIDLMLPGKTGFEVIEEIKTMPTIAQKPIVVFSNKDKAEDREKAKSLGADLYRVKAMTNLNEFVEEIRELVKTKAVQ